MFVPKLPMVPDVQVPTGAAIRFATPDDVAIILAFIRELAEYEKLSAEVVATEASLRETLFGARPTAEVLLCEWEQLPVGFAVFFHNYSTFLGKPGIYLEDLYVRPAHRGRGLGRALLQVLAKIAVQRGCHRLEWAVLDWNRPAIEFYETLGARPMKDWTIYRLSGESLQRVAQSDVKKTRDG